MNHFSTARDHLAAYAGLMPSIFLVTFCVVTFRVNKVVTFCVKKLLHFALKKLLHFASKVVTFRVNVTFCGVTPVYRSKTILNDLRKISMIWGRKPVYLAR